MTPKPQPQPQPALPPIDPAVSARLGITEYGVRGMQMIRNRRMVAKFTTGATRRENWSAAVEWCEEHGDATE